MFSDSAIWQSVPSVFISGQFLDFPITRDDGDLGDSGHLLRFSNVK